MQRLVAEWLTERARFISSLVGLTDEQFNRETAPGQWTYRVVAKGRRPGSPRGPVSPQPGENTTPGKWPIIVSCSKDSDRGELKTAFEVR